MGDCLKGMENLDKNDGIINKQGVGNRGNNYYEKGCKARNFPEWWWCWNCQTVEHMSWECKQKGSEEEGEKMKEKGEGQIVDNGMDRQ